MGRKGGWLSAVIDAFRPRSRKAAACKHGISPSSQVTQPQSDDKNNPYQGPGIGSRWSFASKSPLKTLPKVDEESDQVMSNIMCGDDEMENCREKQEALLAIMAEAAGVVAHAAAEVARLSSSASKSITTTTSSSPSSFSSSRLSSRKPATAWNPCYTHQLHHHAAATKIQKAFRGYIARRAFRILKGRLARAQGLIASPTARKQADTTFQCMRMMLKVQGHIRDRRLHARLRSEEALDDVVQGQLTLQRSERMMLAHLQNGHLNGAQGSQLWDGSHQALPKSPTSQKCNKYSQTRRSTWMSPSCDQIKEEDDEIDLCGMSSTCSTNQTNTYYGARSFQASKSSIGESVSIRNDTDGDDYDGESFMLMHSPSLPRYMCATHSTRAKTRSLSNPKQRPIGAFHDQISVSSARKRLSFPLNDSIPNSTP